jgi:6-phosphogluconolactonase
MKRDGAEYLVFGSSEEIERFLAERWREISLSAVKERDRFSAALSGGQTPVGFYSRLASLEGLPWDRTHIFLVDERFVPPDDADSNYKMIFEVLLNKIHIPSQNVHSISTVGLSPETSAGKYEGELRLFFGLSPQGIPEFDLALLGVGEDGHTASLFPGSEALKEKEHLVARVTAPASMHDRITLTFPALNNAKNIFVLAIGSRKASVMKKLIEGNNRTLPISQIRPREGRLIFLMDGEARGE